MQPRALVLLQMLSTSQYGVARVAWGWSTAISQYACSGFNAEERLHVVLSLLGGFYAKKLTNPRSHRKVFILTDEEASFTREGIFGMHNLHLWYGINSLVIHEKVGIRLDSP